MIVEHNLNPIFINLGPIAIHWYGLMYLVALGTGIFLGSYRAQRANSGWEKEQVSDMAFYLFLGAILGGRIGYSLFYNFDLFIEQPLSILGWQDGKLEWSGMSFHGGLIGVLVATLFIARHYKKGFWEVTDFIAPLIPLGLFFGRIGNYINGELWGRATDQSWGWLFPMDPSGLYRHPSQLYQAFGEGLLLFIILWIFTQKPRPRCAASGLFLVGYGSFRFIAEFFREPDAHIGYLIGEWFTKGMLLSLPMIIAGLLLLLFAYKFNRSTDKGAQ